MMATKTGGKRGGGKKKQSVKKATAKSSAKAGSSERSRKLPSKAGRARKGMFSRSLEAIEKSAKPQIKQLRKAARKIGDVIAARLPGNDDTPGDD